MANRLLVLGNRRRVHELSELDRIFHRFFSEPFRGRTRWLAELSADGISWSPSLDVSENEDAITVKAELPGVDPEAIDLEMTDAMLVISGEKKEESEERGEGLYRTERMFGSFRRSVALPAAVDAEKITADYENGVLTVRLEKVEKDVTKRIPITASKK